MLLILNNEIECSIYSWGLGERGELGLGEDVTSASHPSVVPDFASFSMGKLFAGEYVSFALDGTGWLYQWGNDYLIPRSLSKDKHEGIRSIYCVREDVYVLTGLICYFFLSLPFLTFFQLSQEKSLLF